MHEPPLYETTMELLKNAPRSLTLTEIAVKADVQKSWLSELMRGNIADPGVIKIQKLHDYLISIKTEI